MAETTPGHVRTHGRFIRLARTRFATRLTMIVERLWPRILPLVVVISLFVSISWLGLFRLMPDAVRYSVVASLAALAIVSLWPLRSFRRPTSAQIDKRIERANQLAHEPVAAQSDQLAGNRDGFAEALWCEHQKRMAGKLDNLHGDLPKTGVPERDPWGLRAAAALLLVIAAAFSSSPYGGSVLDAFRTRGGAEVVPPRIDAWVTPPTYTRRAPIYLTAEANRDTERFTVPQGSMLALRVTGGSGSETLSYLTADDTESEIAPEGASQSEALSVDTSAQRFAATLTEDGKLRLKRDGQEIDGWLFSVTPDNPPEIHFSEDPKRAVNGALELTYEIEDDYGPTEAHAIFEQASRAPEALPLYSAPELPLALPRRDGRTTAAKTSRDLTEHPWAGSIVKVYLRAIDDAGQEARSETKLFTLPERTFTNPLAKALIEHRRTLALDANMKPRVLAMMDAVMTWPEETLKDLSQFLGVSAAQSRLETAQTDEQLRDVVDYLWEIALIIEDGDLTAAEKRLRQAQEALKNALEGGASEEEIARLMDELRSAMQEFLREFAERAQQNPNMAQQLPENSQMLNQNDLDRMLDQIEELAKSGARDQARELLSQLENMMNNLQAGRSQQGQSGNQQSEMRQQMDELGNLMRRQQELMNETFRMDQMQRGQRNEQGQEGQGQQGEQDQQGQQGQQGQGNGQQPGEGQGMSPQEFADAMRGLQQGQGTLRQDLESLMQGLEGLGIRPGEGFGEAGDAMGEAEGALGEGEGEQAVGEQGRALEALRRGAQDMMNQLQQAMRGEQGGGEQGFRRSDNGRDPLGRPQATTGPDFGDSVEVPDEIDTQRARRILEAIRKRLGDALSPALEKEYLERLLDMQ
ncbi:TIGR02302 family protein [Nitratireductor kimnyeongensis]|uniref:TIGR02302 family protein n=1 Tax=Nitratireductor kimnyeongensis TaxID=430679 RepID=A0ABW0TC45_9HYPH|nr:TIGR02302 family protein [Nitratireductor kimnyeongensis]QZZ36510.1 TIGR02302 family protein [Nitratireductor kimnyeongensis]